MNSVLNYKTGDTWPQIVARFEIDGDQVDLTSADKVLITFGLTATGTPEFEGECDVEEATEEIEGVETTVWRAVYTLVSEDTAAAGSYDVEFKIIWDEGPPEKIQSVPNKGYDQMMIEESV